MTSIYFHIYAGKMDECAQQCGSVCEAAVCVCMCMCVRQLCVPVQVRIS